MTQQLPSFGLFLQSVSTLAASAHDARYLVAEVLASVKRHLGDIGASITLRAVAGQGLEPVTIERIAPAKGRFVFSRPIAVRSVEYGRLSIEIADPAGSPTEWMYALDTLAQQLAMFAERLRLADERSRLAGELNKLKDSLQTRKKLARAAGILAATHGISVDVAQEQIVGEAAQRGRAVELLAEQVILYEQAQRQIAAPRSRKGAVAA
jgi:hypothetical protein